MIAYTQDNGVVAFCSLASSVPEGTPYIETAPLEDKVFRMAQAIVADELVTDLPKAKEIMHEKRRAAREIEFAPYDEIISKQLPTGNPQLAEQARQDIRDADAVKQTAIDNCTTEAELRGLL